MSISHTATLINTTTDYPVLSKALFPKFVVLPDGGFETWETLQDQQSALGSTSYGPFPVWYPATLPSNENGDYLVFGVDYDTLILVNSPVGNKMFHKEIPAPILTLAQESNGVRLYWTSSYGVQTRMYRTAIFTGSVPPSEYTLIGEMDGVTSPGVSNSYKDIGLPETHAPNKINYMVINQYGSGEATLSFS